MVTAHQVGWYGSEASPLLIFPFATAAGGIAQGAAALWAYKARDGLPTGWDTAGGYVTMASALTAFYAASAMMLAGTFGRVIVPLGNTGVRQTFQAAGTRTPFSSSWVSLA